MENDLLYHYTTVERLNQIIKDKVLKATNNKLEKKVFTLWVSKNEEWESTATKMIMSEGKVVFLTKEEQHDIIGLARIGISKMPKLTSWAKYHHHSKLSPQILDQMESSGIIKGGKPGDWFCLFNNLPQSKWECIEIRNGSKWIEFSHDDLLGGL